MIQDNVKLGLIFGGVCLFFKYFLVFFSILLSKEKISIRNKIDVKEDIFGFFIVTGLFILLLEIYSCFSLDNDYIVSILFSMFVGIIPVTYLFVIQPIYYLFNSKTYYKSNDLTSLVRDYKDFKNVNVRIINKDINNAFATGVVPFIKIILIGKTTLTTFSKTDLKCIILHEMGHIKYNHLLKLYICNVIYISIYLISAFFVFPFFQHSEYRHVLVGIYSGIILGGGLQIVAGLLQKKLEKEADYFAAKMIGRDLYSNMLIKFNEITNGGLEKGAINYPTLKERIQNIEAI